MHQTWVVIIGIAIMGAGIGVIRGEVNSQCEALTREKKSDQAFPVCLAAAKQGDAYAQNIVGISYAAGDGVEQDSGEALKWFYKSAGQGFAKAQSNIALAFIEGTGVARDLDEANRWWQLAAAQGESNAQFNLAVSYGNGFGINRDVGAADDLILASLFSYLKSGQFKRALRSFHHVHFSWPFSSAKSCSFETQA